MKDHMERSTHLTDHGAALVAAAEQAAAEPKPRVLVIVDRHTRDWGPKVQAMRKRGLEVVTVPHG